MNRTLVGRVIALLVLAAFTTWIVRNTYWDDDDTFTPMGGKAVSNEYYALETLLRQVDVRSTQVPSLTAPADTRTVMLVPSVASDIMKHRLASLTPWVEAGGRLVVSTNLVSSDPQLFSKWGIRYVPPKSVVKKPNKPGEMTFEQLAKAPECAERIVSVDGAATQTRLSVCGSTLPSALHSKQVPAWSTSNDQGFECLRVAVGKGSVVILPFSSITTNYSLVKADHAKLLLLIMDLNHGDRVLVFNPASAEKLIPMLWRHAPQGIIFLSVALLLCVLRQLPRFGPAIPAPAPVRRSLAEQMRANAAFFWRARDLSTLRRAARRALDEAAAKRITGYKSLDSRKRAAALAALSGVESGRLVAALTGDAVASASVQRQAIGLLQVVRQRVLERFSPKRAKI
jgi:hypothetical protein